MKTRSWFNKRAIENSESKPDTIPVILKDGRIKWFHFGGFIDLQRAVNMPQRQYIKLKVFAVIDDANVWTDIPEDHYLVGIHYLNKAWVVLDGIAPLQRKAVTL